MRNNKNSFSLKIKVLLVLFLLFLVYCHADICEAVSPPQSNQIRLGSFNIEKLGYTKEFQMKNAAEILRNYDIVAIQEVMNMGATRLHPIGTKGIETLKQIVAYLGNDWDYVVSPEPNGTVSAERSKAFNTFDLSSTVSKQFRR